MARGWLVGVVLIAACGPLTGFQVEDRSTAEQVLLPMHCLDSLGRTTSGMWVCRTNSGIFASRGGDESNSLEGAGVAVGGGAVWTWDDVSGVLLRFEEDPDTGRLFQSPDAGYRWMRGPVVPRVRSVVAHEREIVIAASGLETVRANESGLVQLSHAATSFDNSSIATRPTADVLFEVGSGVWAFGRTPLGSILCQFRFDEVKGITGAGRCDPAPGGLVGFGGGGLWLSESSVSPTRFFLPLLGAIPGTDLPPELAWQRNGVPWVTDPDPTTLLVPRAVGERLIIDRYQASTGFTWAGVTDDWVYEVSTRTRVFAR